MNEYGMRNSISFGLDAVGAREEDVILLSDVDEFPHPRAVESLRALFTVFGPDQPRHERVYKLYPLNFLYNFDCLSQPVDKLLAAGATAATSISYGKQLQGGSITRDSTELMSNAWITRVRMHQQRVVPYPIENVLFPGGWHLSYFGGTQRIQSKLASFSHQNFVRQFLELREANEEHSVEEQDPGFCRQEFSHDQDLLKRCKDGMPLIKPDNGNEILPRLLPNVSHLSLKKISERVQNGLPVDNRKYGDEACRKVQLNAQGQILKRLWITEYDSQRLPSVAVVSGYVGVGPIIVPGVNDERFDWYFLVNNEDVAQTASQHGWTVISLPQIELKDSKEYIDNYIFNSQQSKSMKVFPQSYLPYQYDFVVWFDNKWELSIPPLLSAIQKWDPSIALTLHRRILSCCDPFEEARTAMAQPRYAAQREIIEKYMQEEVEMGWATEGLVSYATGFIVYSMRHPLTRNIQEMWFEHIKVVCPLFNANLTLFLSLPLRS